MLFTLVQIFLDVLGVVFVFNLFFELAVLGACSLESCLWILGRISIKPFLILRRYFYFYFPYFLPFFG